MKNSVGFWKFLSLFSMALLGFLILREDYPRRLKNKLSPPSSSIQYNDYQLNPWFVEQTAFHALFHRHKAIVMLGNSHTFRMQWNELLEREDVANRGIGSDVLGGFLTRLSDVLELSPKVCFIEGGVNDIERDVPIDSSMKYLRSIVDTLRRQVIVPVVIKPIHVAACYPDASGFNHRISVFNKNIDSLLKGMPEVIVMDLNEELSPNGTLLPTFSQKDGIHLTAPAYLIWKQRILKILSETGL